MDLETMKQEGGAEAPALGNAAVVVIDDEESMCEGCRQTLEENGFRTAIAHNGAEGIRLLDEVRPHVALVDLKMPGVSGTDVLQWISDIDPGIVPIVITGYGTIDSAVESMKLGAFDFLTKPFEPEKLLESVRRGMKLSQLRHESTAREEMEIQEEIPGAPPPSRQDVLLKGLSLLGESYSVGLERMDFLEELSRLEAEAKYHAQSLGQVKKREKAILDVVHELRIVDEIIQRHGYRKNALIQILLDAQMELHWLPRHVLKWISERLNIPQGEIYSIGTFYEAFSLEPQGAHTVHVCMGTACHVRGAPDLLRKTSALLGIQEGQTDEKQMFTLKTVHCLGCCALSPVIQVDGSYISNPSLGKLKDVFASLEEEEVNK
ncbi:MAG: NAD(P)H-dependent oxidoreductase subunit E [Deltaproteobacteria bacterium]|nr:NAD(P)H-dependent oxidoreductase subunit E [Deltaproteobacteria bacterium]